MKNSTQHSHTCPHCRKNNVDSMATAPYVRGFLLAYQMGSKSFIGCNSCVRKKLFGEAGLSALIGWFSISSFIINPFLILYNLIQGIALQPKRKEVEAKLRSLGIPENPREVNLTQIGYALAASMIKADGKVEAAEIQMAESIGQKIFRDFDQREFHKLVNSNSKLPSTRSMTALLKNILDENGKIILFRYLAAIAQSDGHIDPKEKQLLSEFVIGLNINTQRLNQALRA